MRKKKNGGKGRGTRIERGDDKRVSDEGRVENRWIRKNVRLTASFIP